MAKLNVTNKMALAKGVKPAKGKPQPAGKATALLSKVVSNKTVKIGKK